MTPLGINEAACVIVGNSIGDSNPKLGYKYWKMCSFITLTYSCILTTLLITYKKEVSNVFTSNAEILELLYGALPFIAFKYIFDAYQGFI